MVVLKDNFVIGSKNNWSCKRLVSMRSSLVIVSPVKLFNNLEIRWVDFFLKFLLVFSGITIPIK